MSKILKCASNEDAITIKAGDDGDTVTYMFESQSEHFFVLYLHHFFVLEALFWGCQCARLYVCVWLRLSNILLAWYLQNVWMDTSQIWWKDKH